MRSGWWSVSNAALLTIKSPEILTSTDWHIYNSFYIWLNLPSHRRRHWQNSTFLEQKPSLDDLTRLHLVSLLRNSEQ
jgi:hypothetical protein